MKLFKTILASILVLMAVSNLNAQCTNTFSIDFQTHCESYTWMNGVTYTSSNSSAKDTIPNAAGCDSIITLALVIRDASTFTDTVVACDSFTWTNGVTYFTNNTVAKDTFSNSFGCDSIVTLHLVVSSTTTFTDVQTSCDSFTWVNGITYYEDNDSAEFTLPNSQGCDSIMTLDLTINSASFSIDTIVACDSALWNGVTYFSSNTVAKDTLVNAVGCDSIITLNLTINNSTRDTLTISACDSFTGASGTVWTIDGTYTDTVPSSASCDSIITYALTFNYSTSSTVVDTACDFYVGANGTVWDSTGIYNDTISNSVGCDSVIVYNLHIKNSTAFTDVRVACDTFTWINGVTYSSSVDSIKDTLTNSVGCDSIVTLDLTINSSYSVVDTNVACDSFTWVNGVTYTSNNTSAIDTLQSVAGCDSIVTLHLTINQSSQFIDTVVACDSFTWIDGVTYTSSNNTAKDTLTNVTGCDSIVTLDLTINSATYFTQSVVRCNEYTWINGVTYDSNNNTAMDTLTNSVGCDSIITLDLVLTKSYAIDTVVACDSFTWINGVTYFNDTVGVKDTLFNGNSTLCDSIITLDLTINPSYSVIDSNVACDSFTWINGLTYYSSNNVAVDTLQTAAGCDSVVLLHLTINESNHLIDTIVACDSFTWIDGVTYTSSNNTAKDTLTNVFGCDSIISLYLTINSTTYFTQQVTRCNEFTWINGVTYTSNNNTAIDTLTNSVGCDSIVTLDLTLTKSYAIDTVVACDSFTWIDGITYYASNNTATDTLFNANATSCDSIITLDLTINNSYSVIDSNVACDSFTWINGVTYYASNNTAVDTLQTVAGCDSIVTLHLTINETARTTDSIVACDSYTWINGVTYTANNNTAVDTLQTVDGCDSIVSLDLTITQSTNFTDYQTHCYSYTWINGVTYTSSNIVTDTLVNAAGCDSIITLVLVIRESTYSTDTVMACNEYTWTNGVTYTMNNTMAKDTFTNVAGCDSIVTLHLTLNKTYYTDTVVACDSFTWQNGVTYYASTNSVNDTLVNNAGCDSILTLHLTMNNAVNVTETVVACDSFTWINGVTYYSSTMSAIDTLQTASGCDSVITLDLTINSTSFNSVIATSCNSYMGASGVIWTTSGTYMDTILNSNGCDSISTYNLTIINSTFDTVTATVCDAFTGLSGSIWNVSGTYTDTIVNAAGCDSITTYVLTVNNSINVTDAVVACDSYTWLDGVTYTSSNNTATLNLTTVNGCDSIVTLNLTINNSTSSTDVQTHCGSYTWIDGVTYTASNNTATAVLTNNAGCDSVVTLDLTINPTSTTNRTAFSCFSYTVPETGNVYTTSGVYTDSVANGSGCYDYYVTTLTINTVTAGTITTNLGLLTIPATGDFYRWLDCDNNFAPVSLGDSSNTFRPTSNGNYACMVFTNEGCIDTSACFSVNNVGIDDNGSFENNLTIFPNPSNSVINVEMAGYDKVVEIRILNSVGKLVYSLNEVRADQMETIDVSGFTAGMYFVSVSNNEIQITKKVIITE